MRFPGVVAGFAAVLPAVLWGQLPISSFRDGGSPVHLWQLSSKTEGQIRVRDVRFTSLSGGAIPAYLVEPAEGCGPKQRACAAVLFVHWYDAKASNANRSEFLPEAFDLARHHAVSLLVNAPWSNPAGFETNDPAQAYTMSMDAVKNLRRALDILVAQPGVDPLRIGCVGHDLGMTYGAILAGIDHRIHALVLMAGSSCLGNWLNAGRQTLNPQQQRQMDDRLSLLCPILYLPHAMGPVFLQFGANDPYVLPKVARSLAEAAPEPNKIRYYESGHALNGQARVDRLEWLALRLRLRPEREE